jgi:hypothetical protein
MSARKTVAAAVKVGQREGLEAMRDSLAAALDVADPAVKAQIAGQLRAVIKDLAALPAVEVEVSASDQLRARREARRNPVDLPSTSRRAQSRRRSGGDRVG